MWHVCWDKKGGCRVLVRRIKLKRDPQEVVWGGMDWIDLAEDGASGRHL